MKINKKYLNLMSRFEIKDSKQIFNILSYYMFTNTCQLSYYPYFSMGEIIYN
jgi:hypothetical protein